MEKPRKPFIIKTRLASGQRVEYHYAWRGGPRLPGLPGSPEYLRAWAEALDSSARTRKGELLSLIVAYRKSPEFQRLNPATARSYNRHLDEIITRFGDMPLAALENKAVRRHFIDYRNEFQDRPRTADYAMQTLKRLLSWCVDEAYLEHNHAAPIGRLYRVDRSEDIVNAPDLQDLLSAASPALRRVILAAVFTGLRESNLLALTRFHDRGDSIIMKTTKRGRKVIIPILPEFRALIDETPRGQSHILVNSKGEPWTPDGLRSSFAKLKVKAGVECKFHDLRRTAATFMMARGVGSDILALLFGWSLETVEDMKRTYISRSELVKSVLDLVGKSPYENATKTETAK